MKEPGGGDIINAVDELQLNSRSYIVLCQAFTYPNSQAKLLEYWNKKFQRMSEGLTTLLSKLEKYYLPFNEWEQDILSKKAIPMLICVDFTKTKHQNKFLSVKRNEFILSSEDLNLIQNGDQEILYDGPLNLQNDVDVIIVGKNNEKQFEELMSHIGVTLPVRYVSEKLFEPSKYQ
jgi:hypothetical protein